MLCKNYEADENWTFVFMDDLTASPCYIEIETER